MMYMYFQIHNVTNIVSLASIYILNLIKSMVLLYFVIMDLKQNIEYQFNDMNGFFKTQNTKNKIYSIRIEHLNKNYHRPSCADNIIT